MFSTFSPLPPLDFSQVLPPSQTVFVIISSDQDYRHHFQLLRNSGYVVVVIHDAKTDGWVNVMELHATEAYRWGDIIPHSKPKSKRKSTGDSSSPPPVSSMESNTTQVVEINHREVPISVAAIAQPSENPRLDTSTSSDWLIGICTHWNKSYGFCQGVVLLRCLLTFFFLSFLQ